MAIFHCYVSSPEGSEPNIFDLSSRPDTLQLHIFQLGNGRRHMVQVCWCYACNPQYPQGNPCWMHPSKMKGPNRTKLTVIRSSGLSSENAQNWMKLGQQIDSSQLTLTPCKWHEVPALQRSTSRTPIAFLACLRGGTSFRCLTMAVLMATESGKVKSPDKVSDVSGQSFSTKSMAFFLPTKVVPTRNLGGNHRKTSEDGCSEVSTGPWKGRFQVSPNGTPAVATAAILVREQTSSVDHQLSTCFYQILPQLYGRLQDRSLPRSAKCIESIGPDFLNAHLF